VEFFRIWRERVGDVVGAGEDVDGALVVAEHVHLGRLSVGQQSGDHDLGVQNVSHDSMLSEG